MSLVNSKFVTVRPIDLLRFVEQSDGSLKIVSDVTLLLNQERIINDLGEDTVRNFIRTLQLSPKSVYSEQNLTDAQLMSHIKSRYCQSPSEVRAWIESLRDEMESMKFDIEQAQAEAEAQARAEAEAQAQAQKAATGTGTAAATSE